MADEKPKKQHTEQINANLKRVYDEVVSEDVPDRFHELLAQLKKQDETSGSGDRS
ncbi:MAG: NepR family anti-sigma factor [Pseudomonadota bacterium]